MHKRTDASILVLITLEILCRRGETPRLHLIREVMLYVKPGQAYRTGAKARELNRMRGGVVDYPPDTDPTDMGRKRCVGWALWNMRRSQFIDVSDGLCAITERGREWLSLHDGWRDR